MADQPAVRQFHPGTGPEAYEGEESVRLRMPLSARDSRGREQAVEAAEAGQFHAVLVRDPGLFDEVRTIRAELQEIKFLLKSLLE